VAALGARHVAGRPVRRHGIARGLDRAEPEPPVLLGVETPAGSGPPGWDPGPRKARPTTPGRHRLRHRRSAAPPGWDGKFATRPSGGNYIGQQRDFFRCAEELQGKDPATLRHARHPIADQGQNYRSGALARWRKAGNDDNAIVAAGGFGGRNFGAPLRRFQRRRSRSINCRAPQLGQPARTRSPLRWPTRTRSCEARLSIAGLKPAGDCAQVTSKDGL
jgi:hypothetical protein